MFMGCAVVTKGDTRDASLGMLRDPDDGIGFASGEILACGEHLHRRALLVLPEVIEFVGDPECLRDTGHYRVRGIGHGYFELAVLVMALRAATDKHPIIL